MTIVCSACFLIKEKDGSEDLFDVAELIDLPDSTIILGASTLDSTKIKPMYPEQDRIDDLVTEIAALKAQVRDYDSRIRLGIVVLIFLENSIPSFNS